VGRRELNPFAGRHHTKAAIVDDVVYAGGGINLTSGSFAESHDYMWRLDDAELADSLYEQLPGLSDQLSEDKVVYKSSDFEVIVDTGAKGESLIYNRTC